jgi:hypothetical protein
MSCQSAHLDGSYVLGALDPAERQEFERHLGGCAECSRAVAELAGLPGLLGRVDPEVLDAVPVDLPVPETLLPALVQEVRRTQRRRLLVTTGLAAAAVVAVVGAVVATGVVGAGDSGPGTAAPTASADPGDAGREMVAVVGSPVSARLTLESVDWGTRLDLTCSYASTGAYGSPGPSPGYSMVVRSRDGRVEQVASWRALPGRTMRLSAATATDRADIVSVEVRTAEGEPVLRLAG